MIEYQIYFFISKKNNNVKEIIRYSFLKQRLFISPLDYHLFYLWKIKYKEKEQNVFTLKPLESRKIKKLLLNYNSLKINVTSPKPTTFLDILDTDSNRRKWPPLPCLVPSQHNPARKKPRFEERGTRCILSARPPLFAILNRSEQVFRSGWSTSGLTASKLFTEIFRSSRSCCEIEC